MSRIFKIASLINCKLTNTSPHHKNLLLVTTVFCISKDNKYNDRIFGDISHYKNLFENKHKKIKELEESIKITLKRHNGHRLVHLHNNQFAIIYPKKEMIRLGSSRSVALATWYRYWKNKKQ